MSRDSARSGPPDTDAVGLLLEFLRDRDVNCPGCGYNLRDLTQPQCPECEQSVTLCVSVPPSPVLPLVVTVAPGIFSGIMTILLCFFAVIGGAPIGQMPWFVWLLLGFGAASGVTALFVSVKARAFVRQPIHRQFTWAAVAWSVHLAAFMILLAAMF